LTPLLRRAQIQKPIDIGIRALKARYSQSPHESRKMKNWYFKESIHLPYLQK